jgi:hypothetical protein
MCAVVVVGAMILHRVGSVQKWQVALGMTVVPFWYITGVFRSRWGLVSFWGSLTVYLVLHLAAIWFVFSKILSGTSRVPYALSVPITMVEGVVIAMAVDGLQRKMRRKNRHQLRSA